MPSTVVGPAPNRATRRSPPATGTSKKVGSIPLALPNDRSCGKNERFARSVSTGYLTWRPESSETHDRSDERSASVAQPEAAQAAALAPESQEKLLAVRRQSEQLILDVIERGIRLGEFDVPDPWLAYAAIGSMGIRVAEWWDQLDFDADRVADIYAEFAVRLLVGTSTP